MIQKIKDMFFEKNPIKLKGRILISASISFAVVFTTMLNGVLEIYLNNADEFQFSLFDFLTPLLLSAVAVIVICTVLMCLFKKTLFYIVSALGLGFLISEYIQAQFLNAHMQELTGQETTLNLNFQTVGNLILWFSICLICVFMSLLLKSKWKVICVFVSASLFVVQGSGLAVSFINNIDSLNNNSSGKYVMTRDNITEISEKENTLVFILDTLDAKYTNQILSDEPDFFKPLDGFTYYNNFLSNYSKTFPAIPYLLTGKPFFCDSDFKEYFNEAYEDQTFLKEIKNNNYKINLYTVPYSAYIDAGVFSDVSDNITCLSDENSEYSINTKQLFKLFFKLSCYRYFPNALQSIFNVNTEDFDYVKTYHSDIKVYSDDNLMFYNEVCNNGLKTQTEKNTFSFIHLNGSHPPYTLKEDLSQDPDTATAISEAKGSFKILFEYISQMKKLGLYKNANIMIMADHGLKDDYTSLDSPMLSSLFIKKKGSENTPLSISDVPASQANFQATIVDLTNIKTDVDYGTSIFDISEQSSEPRHVYYKLFKKDGSKYLEEYIVNGNANDFSNWTKGEIYPVKDGY